MRSFFSVFFLAFLMVAFCACGLETYYVMEATPIAIRRPDYTNSDPSQNYFDFVSAENSNSGNEAFKFLGTKVYYKIYTNAQTMVSNLNQIESLNSSDDYSAAANRLINSYKYVELATANGIVSPLVPQTGRHVRIRLTNYYESNSASLENKAQIIIDGEAEYLPRRNLGAQFSFDFGRLDKNEYKNTQLKYDAPQSDDEDFVSGTVSDKKYYIDMYAVAVGRDTTFATYYSNVEYLGSVTIDSGQENN